MTIIITHIACMNIGRVNSSVNTRYVISTLHTSIGCAFGILWHYGTQVHYGCECNFCTLQHLSVHKCMHCHSFAWLPVWVDYLEAVFELEVVGSSSLVDCQRFYWLIGRVAVAGLLGTGGLNSGAVSAIFKWLMFVSVLKWPSMNEAHRFVYVGI